MADVVIVQRKHYSGLDADKAGVTAMVGDTFAATDTGKWYYWDNDKEKWSTGVGYEFVSRNVATPDFTLTNFVTDGTWKIDGLDLSGILPPDAKAVLIKIVVEDELLGSVLTLRKNATDVENTIESKTVEKNMPIQVVDPIAIDPDRKLDYFGTNEVFTTIKVSVLGWYA